MHEGSCLCGAIRFEVEGNLPPVEGCHCRMCRKWTGHFLTSVEVPRESLKISGSENISWFVSSAKVRRGFCACCGSSLFFDPIDTARHAWTAIAMGAFETPTATAMGLHIFVADKGDYYSINDGLPQNEH